MDGKHSLCLVCGNTSVFMISPWFALGWERGAFCVWTVIFLGGEKHRGWSNDGRIASETVVMVSGVA